MGVLAQNISPVVNSNNGKVIDILVLHDLHFALNTIQLKRIILSNH